jgi:UDP-glucose 4-epimerase
MTRYLITGGAGFIGSHLAEALLAQGDAVWAIDDLSTGSIDNIEPLKANPRFHYVIDSIMNQPLMAEMIDRVDGVFHLAAAVGVKLIFEHPVETIQTNIRGSEIVLELAARKKRKVQVASSSEVYGKGVRVPFAEDDDLLLGPSTCPRWSYACSKLIDEYLALAYWREKQMPTVVTRFFNTVGPRQTGAYGMVIPRFVGQALRGEPLTVHGTGSQSRCFGHVRDVVRALIALMESDRANGQVFNVGNPQEVTILELAEKIVAMTGSRSKIETISYDAAYGPDFEDLERRVPDARKLAGVIDWSNLTPLDAILADVIAWMKSQA